MFMPPLTVAASSEATGSVKVPILIRSPTVNGSLANLRMVRIEPSSDSGGTITLTRDPSARRASTIGEDSSIRRPTDDTMRSMTRRRWSSEMNRTLVRSIKPARST